MKFPKDIQKCPCYHGQNNNLIENIETQTFKEGRIAFQPIWWNALKTYFMFLIPGLAKSADASKDIEEWRSYGQKIYNTSQNLELETPLLTLNYDNKNK